MTDQAGLIRKERSEGRNYDLYDDRDAPEIFLDGFSDVLLNPFTAKLVFHVVDSISQPRDDAPVVETRRVGLRMTMPTPTLIEMMTLVMKGYRDTAPALLAQMQTAMQALQEAARQGDDRT